MRKKFTIEDAKALNSLAKKHSAMRACEMYAEKKGMNAKSLKTQFSTGRFSEICKEGVEIRKFGSISNNNVDEQIEIEVRKNPHNIFEATKVVAKRLGLNHSSIKTRYYTHVKKQNNIFGIKTKKTKKTQFDNVKNEFSRDAKIKKPIFEIFGFQIFKK
jgi:hypothetical protein